MGAIAVYASHSTRETLEIRIHASRNFMLERGDGARLIDFSHVGLRWDMPQGAVGQEEGREL